MTMVGNLIIRNTSSRLAVLLQMSYQDGLYLGLYSAAALSFPRAVRSRVGVAQASFRASWLLYTYPVLHL